MALSLVTLKEKRAQIRVRVDHVDALVQKLSSRGEVDDAAAMQRILSVLDDEIRPYMEWEGRLLHPVIDKYAGEGPSAAASMRYEHVLIDRWIGKLAASVRDAQIDPTTFVRRTDGVLGLLNAHLEVEDRLLLPVLDLAFPSIG